MRALSKCSMRRYNFHKTLLVYHWYAFQWPHQIRNFKCTQRCVAELRAKKQAEVGCIQRSAFNLAYWMLIIDPTAGIYIYMLNIVRIQPKSLYVLP